MATRRITSSVGCEGAAFIAAHLDMQASDEPLLSACHEGDEMGWMAKNAGVDSEQLVGDYERSGLTRREYCERQGIAVTTLDYHQRRRRTKRATANLVPVTVTAAPVREVRDGGFALVLSNGRRIESGWHFVEENLARFSPTQNNGQITQMADALSGETVSYTYDALKRVSVGQLNLLLVAELHV